MSEYDSDNLTVRESFRKADRSGRTALALALWFGAGLMPKMPGTFGTLTAIPLAVAVNYIGGFFTLSFLVIFIFIAVWSSGVSETLLGRDDPREVVIDEVAGYLLAIFLLPQSWISLCAGFVLFRFFDILKPFPIRDLEKKVRGGTGSVLDDLLAGIYANLGVRVFLLLYY